MCKFGSYLSIQFVVAPILIVMEEVDLLVVAPNERRVDLKHAVGDSDRRQRPGIARFQSLSIVYVDFLQFYDGKFSSCSHHFLDESVAQVSGYKMLVNIGICVL